MKNVSHCSLCLSVLGSFGLAPSWFQGLMQDMLALWLWPMSCRDAH